MVEGGYPEAVLTTDPKHANQQVRILKAYLAKTKGLFGRIPGFAAGGLITPRQTEMDLLSSIQRAPSMLAGIPTEALAGSTNTGGPRNQRFIFLDDQRELGNWLNSPEGDDVFVEKLLRNQAIIRRLAKN